MLALFVLLTQLFGRQADLKTQSSTVISENANVTSSTKNEPICAFPFTAKHYDPDTTEPISSGLQSLEELLSWKRSEANPFNVATVPLANREPSLASTPHRTLVSHDMMGGYLDDR